MKIELNEYEVEILLEALEDLNDSNNQQALTHEEDLEYYLDKKRLIKQILTQMKKEAKKCEV